MPGKLPSLSDFGGQMGAAGAVNALSGVLRRLLTLGELNLYAYSGGMPALYGTSMGSGADGVAARVNGSSGPQVNGVSQRVNGRGREGVQVSYWGTSVTGGCKRHGLPG